MGIESLGWIIHEKACYLMRAFDERIEDQFEWVTEALAEAKKTLTDPTIQLIPKTPSEKKKRLKIWRRHGAGFGYRRFSNSRTSSNFRGSYVSIKKSPPPDVSRDFSSTKISVCRTDLMDNFSETTPKSSSFLNRQQQPEKVVTMATVAVQTDDVFIMQSIEPICYLLGSKEPDICVENGCSKTVFCNGTQSEKHTTNSSVDLIDFLASASEKSHNGLYDEKERGLCAEKLCHERNCLILNRDEIHNCLASQLIDKILPPSTPDDCRRVAVLQTKVHKFEHDQHFQSIVLTFRKTMTASEYGKGGSETVLNGDTREALQQTSMSSEQPVRNTPSMNSVQEQRVEKENSTNKHLSSPSVNSSVEKQVEIKIPTANNHISPTKTFMSLAPEIIDLIISKSGTERYPVEPLSNVRRSSSSVSSLSTTGSRSLDSLDVQVIVDSDNERRSNNEDRDSVYCAVSYDSYEINSNSVATVSTIGNFDVSGIEVIPDDPIEPTLNNNAAAGICCNLSLSKICGTEIDTDDALSDDDDVRDATKRTTKRRSKIPGRTLAVKQRSSCVVGARMSLSKRKSLVKASAGRKSLLRSRVAAAQKNSFAATQNLESNAVHSTAKSAATNTKRSSGYRIYKSARRRSSAIAVRPALGACTAPSLRYQLQRIPTRRDLLVEDRIAGGKSGGMVTPGKSGGLRRSNGLATPVAASKSRVQKLRKLFSPHSKSKTPAPNGATPASTPRAAPTTPPSRRSKLQMWRGAELSQPSTLTPGTPSTGKTTWLKASPFMHCFNAPRRSSVIENARMKGKTTPGTNASSSKSANRFLKASQKPGTPSGDAERSGTPRRGLFKRLQDKIKTPGKDSPRACLTPQPKGGPLGHCSETKEVFGSSKPLNSNNFTAENPHSLQVPTSASPVVCITSVQSCVASDVGSVQSAGTTLERMKALKEAELKVLLDVCSLDPSADEALVIANSDALSSYDITDLQPDTDDSDDDDETSSLPRSKSPVRIVPLWAEGRQLALAVIEHFYRSVDAEKLFGRIVPPDLNEMFDKKKPRFDKRTSSANWEHPLDLRPFQP